MTTPPSPLPTLGRSLLLALASAIAAAVLWWLPGGWPPAEPARLVPWWDAVGAADATMVLVRVAGLALAVTGVVVGATASLVATGRIALVGALWVRWAPASVRRALAVTTVAATVATAGPVAAAEGVGDPPVLVDLGPVAAGTGPPPRLADLGPAAAEPEATPPRAHHLASVDADPDPDDRWVVAPGDHLWSIAEETLRDRGAEPGEAEIARYWRRLIDLNRDAIGGDPDFVLPGLVLRLPR